VRARRFTKIDGKVGAVAPTKKYYDLYRVLIFLMLKTSKGRKQEQDEKENHE